tara:strand:- start:3596 stop:4411 length:816 start_codon:yes stop_codon:yes gene_type:complete
MQLLKEVQGKPKAILLAGAPGAGKGYILDKVNLSGLKTLNLDDTIVALSKKDGFTLNQLKADFENRSKFMQAMRDATTKLKGNPEKGIKGDLPQTIENRESFVLDGTSASEKQTIKLLKRLEQAGYDILMLYVYTDLETALDNNQKRYEKAKEEGKDDRSLLPGAVIRTWKDVTKNFNTYKNEFDNFVSVANTGDSETMKNIKDILQTYVDPFQVKDGIPKTSDQQQKSDQAKDDLNKEIQAILQSDQIQNIINTSVSSDEAKKIINTFLK